MGENMDDFTVNIDDLDKDAQQLLKRLQALRKSISPQLAIRLNGWIRYGDISQLWSADDQICSIETALNLRCWAKKSGSYTRMLQGWSQLDVQLFDGPLDVFTDRAKLDRLRTLVGYIKEEDYASGHSSRWGSYSSPPSWSSSSRYDSRSYGRTPDADETLVNEIRSVAARGPRRRKGGKGNRKPQRESNPSF